MIFDYKLLILIKNQRMFKKEKEKVIFLLILKIKLIWDKTSLLVGE